jgi:hypothetical protein
LKFLSRCFFIRSFYPLLV